MTRQLTVILERNCAQVRGNLAHDLLKAVGARPVWSAVSKAWMVQPGAGRDVAALAEARGYMVELRTQYEPRGETAKVPSTTPKAAPPAGSEQLDLFGEAS